MSKRRSGFFKIKCWYLTDFGVKIRYPDDFYTPSIQESIESYKIAETIKEVILNKLEFY
jgi:hypothetical protein